MIGGQKVIMHIAYITSEFVTERLHGGLATYLDNITTIMSEHGHRVTVITLSEQEGRLRYKDNIEVVRVPFSTTNQTDSFEQGVHMLRNSWKLRCALYKEEHRQKIDIVQTANWQAVGFFRNRRIPTIVRASSDSSLLRNADQYLFDYNKALREKTLEDYLELYCVKRADAAFAPSHFCASIIGKRCGRTVEVIESPYINYNKEMDEHIYREKLFHKKYILFNSSLSRLKGTHVGVEATEQLLEKYTDLYMVYAGYDNGLSQMDGGIQNLSLILERQNKKYEGRVLYLRHLKHSELFPIMKNSLACILPSRVDNLPNSCIEAMALGKVVIGTYGASFEQLIRNKENGLLIKRDSSVALIKAVDWLMNLSEGERSAIGERAADTIKRLSPEKIYDEMITFYQKTISMLKKN